MKRIGKQLGGAACGLALVLSGAAAHASSHMDAPLITLDDAANTTDVYAFVTGEGDAKKMFAAVAVYPFEEPGIGPNKYNFDDNVRYDIHVAVGDDLAAGRPTLTYRFDFDTTFRRQDTILQSYLGVVDQIGDATQNLVQTYTLTRIDRRAGFGQRVHVLGDGVVPPNNQGIATPRYNLGGNGENPARQGVATEAELDDYTRAAIADFGNGYRAFAGQRDDGFYADIQAVFDLLSLRSHADDAQGGFNVHLMALEIPVSEMGGDQQIVGVYATTSRRSLNILRRGSDASRYTSLGPFVQVARQGNPLFNEAFVALADKDLYNRSGPDVDQSIFARYALEPELCRLINGLGILPGGFQPCIETGRTDLAGIYIPDLIKVDLSTAAARLAGGFTSDNPGDEGFSRLSIFGGDVLESTVQDPFGNGGLVPGGWPNGRRFGDDVLDIALTAAVSDLRGPGGFVQGPIGDNVDHNDTGYNTVFPYAATPHNGRVHPHH